MLKMAQVHVIRDKVLREGTSQRQVARVMGISRNTVKKYLEVPEPWRMVRHPKRKPVFERVAGRLEELVREWNERTTRKQRITGTRLHQQLVEEGYAVGVTLVRSYLREWRRRRAEVYVPLVHRAGDEAQVDFFEVTVEEDGERRKAWQFLMRLMYSGRDFVWLYDRCDQLAFLDGHVRAFRAFGGVPARCVYDNLKPAVAQATFPRRQLTRRFQALASHYLFEPCFARIGVGHDKGGVESRGGAIRLQHLVPIPRGDSLSTIARTLLERIDAQAVEQRDVHGVSVAERFAQERVLFRPLPLHPFDARKIVPVAVRSTATVKVEGAWYSVPSRWARLDATAHVGVEEIEVVCRGESVVHPRQRFGGRSIRYRHYLQELATKPQAVRQVAPELVSELGEPFRQLWTMLEDTYGAHDGARVMARVLGAIAEQGEEQVRAAVGEALRAPRGLQLPLAPIEPVRPALRTIPVPAALAAYQVPAARAADYDALLVGGAA
jgi:transposase